MQTSRTFSLRIFAACALLGASLAGLLGCDNLFGGVSGTGNAGGAGTGNAGRVAGVVRLADLGVQADTRLFRIEAERTVLVRSTPTNSEGLFVYDSIPTGTYVVEAWKEDVLAGRSDEFIVTRATSQIVIVLVKPVFVHLDLRALGNVDSAYLNYPANPVVKTDSLWTLRDVAVDSIGYKAALFTKVTDESGAAVWLSWKLTNVGGRLELAGLAQGPVPTIHSVDAGSYYPTRHTIALWTFDSITPDGRIKDLSPYGNDLVSPYGGYLTPSPHGRALQIAKLNDDLRVVPTSQWWRSDYQTIRLRIRITQPLQQDHLIFGSEDGLNITVDVDGQLHLSLLNGSQFGWSYYDYRSLANLLEVGTWTEIAVTIDSKQNGIALWKNGVPAPVFAMIQMPGRIMKFAKDTITINGIWDNGKPRAPLEIDEMEISDTAFASLENISQPTFSIPISKWYERFGHGSVVFGFNSASETNSALSMDTSGTIYLGGSQSIYFKMRDSTLLAREVVVYSNLFILLASASPGLGYRFAAYEAYSSFESKVARNIAPVAGIDYATTPISIVTTEGAMINLPLTTLAARWASDPRNNHGVVIQALDKSQADVWLNYELLFSNYYYDLATPYYDTLNSLKQLYLYVSVK